MEWSPCTRSPISILDWIPQDVKQHLALSLFLTLAKAKRLRNGWSRYKMWDLVQRKSSIQIPTDWRWRRKWSLPVLVKSCRVCLTDQIFIYICLWFGLVYVFCFGKSLSASCLVCATCGVSEQVGRKWRR